MQEKLDKWFGLPKHKMTPELEKELKALRLRANFDPKRRGLEGPRVSSINQSPTAQQFPMSNLVLIHTIYTDLMWRSFFETRTGNPRPFQGDTHPAEPSLESHASQVPVLGFGTRPQGSNLSTFGSKLGQGFSVGFPTGQGGSRKQFSGSGSFRFVWFPFRGPSHFCLALGQWIRSNGSRAPRFYKANDRQELPKYFTIATEAAFPGL